MQMAHGELKKQFCLSVYWHTDMIFLSVYWNTDMKIDSDVHFRNKSDVNGVFDVAMLFHIKTRGPDCPEALT